MKRFLYRAGRLVAVATLGIALIAVGAVMLVTPGPGLLVIVAGLAVLAMEFTWARRLREHLTQRVRDLARRRRVGPIELREPDDRRDSDAA